MSKEKVIKNNELKKNKTKIKIKTRKKVTKLKNTNIKIKTRKKVTKLNNTNIKTKTRKKVNNNKFNILKSVGILDPEGKKPNPLTGEPYENLYKDEMLKGTDIPLTYKSLAEKAWVKLPVYNKREEIIKAMDKYQILLGISGTGSGKSVLLPKFALHISNYKKKVLCCIPKRSSARSAAEFAAKCMDTRLGDGVGYFFKGDRKVSSNTMLTFTTTGSLASKLTASSGNIDEYGTIIMDEIHEASVQSIILLLLLKRIAEKRPDLKIVLMSATVDEKKYADYFPSPKFNFGSINVGQATTYPIESKWLSKPIDIKRELEDKLVSTIIEILKSEKEGDILGFVRSGGEGRKTCDALQRECKQLGYNVFCTELEGSSIHDRHPISGISKHNYAEKVTLYKEHPNINKNNPPDRKIVLSTNVAESSITVEGVVFVIDSGLEFLDKYNPEEMARSLKDEYVAKAAVRQRMGRAGRTQPGICYHLYTEDQFKNFRDYPIPDMQKTDLSTEMIDIFRMNDVNSIGEMRLFFNQLIDPPDEIFIKSALMILYALGAITSMNNEGTVTEIGDAISKFRSLKPTHAKSILSAYYNWCKEEVIDIISIIASMDGQLSRLLQPYRPPKKGSEYGITRKEFDTIRSKFIHKYGDHLTLLKIYEIFKEKQNSMSGGELKKWCKENYINYNVLNKTKKTAQEINRTMSSLRVQNRNNKNNKSIKVLNLDLNINNVPQKAGSLNNLEKYFSINDSLKNKEDKILKSLLDGCYINVALQMNKNKYISCFPPKKVEATLDRDTTIKTFGKVCMYDELFSGNMGLKYNIVSKFPTSIINNLNIDIKDLLKKCKSSKNEYAKKNKKNQKKGKRSFRKGKRSFRRGKRSFRKGKRSFRKGKK